MLTGKTRTCSSISYENLPLSHSSTHSVSDIAKAGASILLGAFQQKEPEAASHKASEKKKDNQSDVHLTSCTHHIFPSFMKTNESSSAHLITIVTGFFQFPSGL